MKPCKSCPFMPTALPGLWDAAHYLAIAYLGSADVPRLIGTRMGCHQWNGHLSKDRSAPVPTCGGWVRAARNTSLAIRYGVYVGSIDAADVQDEGVQVLTPEDMLRQNGIDVDRLPPLQWSPAAAARWGSHDEWSKTVLDLRAQMLADPSLAREYVLPGSPLSIGVTRDQVAEFMGEAAARAYFDADPVESLE